MTAQDWPLLSMVKDVVLFGLAIYGAALSTFNWRQAVRRDRRAIAVKLSTAMPTYNNGQVGPCFAKIEATNAGHRPVTVTMIALDLPSGGRLFRTAASGFPGIPDTSLPATLPDGQSAFLFVAYQDIAAALMSSGRSRVTEVTPVCEDSVGIIYKGKPWKIDPAEFARM